jgi:hypothetical protein
VSSSRRYDPWSGDLNLCDPRPRPLDRELSALCRRFAASRKSTVVEDIGTLLAFSRRAAVFAMREGQPEHIVDGLTAIAQIDGNRADFRDLLLALSLLDHASRRIGVDSDRLLAEAASLAEPPTSEWIHGYRSRTGDQRDLRKSWGYTVVETEAGPGFVGWGGAPFQPSCALDLIALALARAVQRDEYEPARITLASELPPVWLSAPRDGIRGVVSIHAELRPKASPDYEHQILMLFLAELETESAAETLVSLARVKQAQPNPFAMLAVSHGPLFCLAIGRCVLAGKPPFETNASLQRFAPAIAAALHRC